MKKRTSIAFVFCSALIGVIAPSPTVSLSAQGVERIDAAQPSCPRCTLELTKIATLGSVDDPSFPGVGMRATGLAINHKGQFLNTSLGSDQVLVYSPTGKFLRAIGRKGNGPGEFRQARQIEVDAYDTVFVVDVGRVSVFSPTFEYVRTVAISIDAPQTALLLPNKSILLAFQGGYRFGELQLVTDSKPMTRFPSDASALEGCAQCELIIAHGNSAGRLWSSWNTRYNLLEWNDAGSVVQSLSVVGSSWHRPSEIVPGLGRTMPVPPRVLALAEDNKKQLWVHGEMPTPNWEPPPPLQSAGTARGSTGKPIGSAFAGPELLKRLISVVDVFDRTTNRLIISQRFPNRKLRLVAPGILAEVREDKDDVPVWDIFRVDIKRP